ncbi:class I SAM-dependent methyltransferase [Fodinibius halophilus]|uniref:Class I SAM-dependent methyltransferase n=1 Tax=Fodinibius halophilus TaxID=1736908 RepID=A0A6M1SZY1_9BACT|nr:class I SAM-dependent methyltransferase [Fodinibius halophilus]NGP87247.1 class I SAM-dependent methyltransferase [Fodinibius halophilus]
MSVSSCTLCGNANVHLFYQDQSDHYASDYYQCPNCRLIFASPKDRPSTEEEFERYETHENDPNDEGYRNFLGQLFEPLNKKLEPGSKGLDFGSGPGPTLNLMFEEQGHDMNIYDPFYADDETFFDEKYDFITATEVVEHLFHPRKEFDRLWDCLKPGGYLGIMTKIAEDDKTFFANWHYRLDETHVTFYTKQTFEWLANKWNASINFPAKRVVIFKKSE